ncbi:MSHA pilin protein MshA [Colwellia chukchiensis]|uniref:MSHA pilin protein MshA n=1 Tax=Colwellia chukchiensis TaxID=641665 RepID=A0A1H7LAJ1_9GAMM|nr:prepilin-type N-terminal cleavage/methylation domain-containing protein [Colwellia chukchiensis]SEK95884.1 MSHA pilin protein MshA [Colwellia chukchiensis]
MKKLASKNLQTQKGFTLIELVVVIVILGILAATAAPKFIDLTGDAKASVVQGVQGSVNSAINLVHAKAIVSNQTGATGEVLVNGEYYAVVYGYPTRAGAGTPDGTTGKGWGIDKLIELESGSDITYDSATGDFEHSQGSTPDNCKATFSDATKAGNIVTPAAVALDVSGC